MNSLIITIIPIIIVSILILLGLIILQVFQSKKVSKWPGLILPGCSILIASVAALSSHVFFKMGSVYGQVIASLIMFAVGNIPTLIYIVIYILTHTKRVPSNSGIPQNTNLPLSKNQEINKMNIQDLY